MSNIWRTIFPRYDDEDDEDEENESTEKKPRPVAPPELSRQIWLIAGVFYLGLILMVVLVFVLIIITQT
jgi:hypothetical protein